MYWQMRLALAASLFGVSLAAAVAGPGSYPTRPVRMIVPSGTGGGTDIVGRLLAQKLSESWGQQVVVDNRPGAASVIGVEIAARSAPDGYTVVMVSSGFVINPSLIRNIPYDPVRDFAPIIHAASVPNVLVTHPSIKVNTTRELVALARGKPGQLAYASAGTGSSPHLSMELLRIVAGIELIHVPYKGSGPAIVDVIGGRVPIMFPNLPTAMPHLKSGKLRALGVTTVRRSPAVPDVPAIAESFPGYEAVQWYGLLAPAGTPAAVVTRIHGTAAAALAMPDVMKMLAEQGAEIPGGTPGNFASFIVREKKRWAEVIARAGISAN